MKSKAKVALVILLMGLLFVNFGNITAYADPEDDIFEENPGSEEETGGESSESGGESGVESGAESGGDTPVDPTPVTPPAPEPEPTPDPTPTPDPNPTPDPTPTPDPNPTTDPAVTPDVTGETTTEELEETDEFMDEDYLESELIDTYVRSNNTNITGITLKSGELRPGFSSQLDSYFVYLEPGKHDMDIVVSVEDPNATGSISKGEDDIGINKESRVITVTAEDGTTRTIKIIFAKLEVTDMKFGEVWWRPVTQPILTNLPNGFKRAKMKFNGGNIDIAISESGDLALAQLQSYEDRNAFKWMAYDVNKSIFYDAKLVKKDGENYVELASGTSVLYGDNGNQAGYYFMTDSGELIQTSGASSGSIEIVEETINDNTLAILIAIILAAICAVLGVITYKQRKRPKQFKQIIERPYLTVPSKSGE